MGNNLKGMHDAIEEVEKEESVYKKTEREKDILNRAASIGEIDGPKGKSGFKIYE